MMKHVLTVYDGKLMCVAQEFLNAKNLDSLDLTTIMGLDVQTNGDVSIGMRESYDKHCVYPLSVCNACEKVLHWHLLSRLMEKVERLESRSRTMILR